MRALLLALAVATGCGGTDQNATDRASPGSDGFDTDTGSNVTDSTATTPETDAATPVWWNILGLISTTGGVVDPAASNLQITLLDVDLTVVCLVEGAPVSVEPAIKPDLALLTWWTVTGATDASCPVPGPIVFGFGPYDPLLDPGASAALLDPTGLNGLYTVSGSELWVFGVAGTAEQFAGDAQSLGTAPLTDGVWRYASLYLLPYPR